MKAFIDNFLIIRWPSCDLTTNTLLISFITGISKERAVSFHQAHLFLTFLISPCPFHTMYLFFNSHECRCFSGIRFYFLPSYSHRNFFKIKNVLILSFSVLDLLTEHNIQPMYCSHQVLQFCCFIKNNPCLNL